MTHPTQAGQECQAALTEEFVAYKAAWSDDDCPLLMEEEDAYKAGFRDGWSRRTRSPHAAASGTETLVDRVMELEGENARHRESIRCMSQVFDDLSEELGVATAKDAGDVDLLFEAIIRQRDALVGLRWSHGCWCNERRENSSIQPVHERACLSAAKALGKPHD